MMVPLRKTPHEVLQERLSKICHDILQNSFLQVNIHEFELKENIKTSQTTIQCRMLIGDEVIDICGKGKGIVDALYSSIILQLSEKYSSLKDIFLLDFAIEADFEKSYKKSGTDAKVEARVLIQGSNDSKFVFRKQSRSMTAAAVMVVAEVVEYFINSEEAVGVLYGLIQNAKERSRPDLSDGYVSLLSELVKNVSYENKMKILSEVHMNCDEKS